MLLKLPVFHTRLKNANFFCIGLSHHEQPVKKQNKMKFHFWPKLNFLEVGSYPLPFFLFPSFSFFPPSLLLPSLLPLSLFFFLPSLPPSSSSSSPSCPRLLCRARNCSHYCHICTKFPPPPASAAAPYCRVRDTRRRCCPALTCLGVVKKRVQI